jgi:hypothetical protein
MLKTAPTPFANESNEALTWHTPVRFDSGMLKRLIEQHLLLAARLDSLPERYTRNREDAWRGALACASLMRDLRRQEAMWIYPVIAHGIANDAKARRRLLNLRFQMNGLARRTLRQFEDLAVAARQANDFTAGVATAANCLREYRARNESELYTLYCLMDPRRASGFGITAMAR